MANIINELAVYLASKGYGTTLGNNPTITLFYMPSAPDNIISLFPDGGLIADGKDGYDIRDVQIRVRNTNAITAYNTVNNIYGELQGLHHITLSEGTFLVNALGIQSGPTSLGFDDMKRTEFVLNFRITFRNRSVNRV